MIIELQIGAAVLMAAFRENMRQQLACQFTEFPLLRTQWRITSYEIGTTKLQRSQAMDGTACVHVGAPDVVTPIQVRTIQLVQQLTVNTCREDLLVDANGALGPNVALHMDLIFAIETDSCGSMRQLCFRYLGTNPPEAGASLGSVPALCISLPLDAVLAEVLPAGMPLINSHLALGPDAQLIAVRMEYWKPSWQTDTGDPARTLPYWNGFYSGLVSNHLGQAEQFSVFVDQVPLVYQAVTLLRDSFKNTTSTRLNSGPDGSWINNGGTGRIHVSFNADSIDACRCFTKEIDVNADVDLDIDTTVPSPNTLRQDISVDVDPDFWDSTCCVVTAALFWPIVGAEQFAKQNVNSGEYLLGFLPFVALIGALLQVANASSKPDPPSGFTKDDDDGTHLFRVKTIDLKANPTLGTMALTASRAVDDEAVTGIRGLVVAGTVTIAVRHLPVLANLEVPNLDWGAGGHCSRTLSANALIFLETVTPGDQASLSLCGFDVIDDSLNIFSHAVQYQRDSGNRQWLTISLPFARFPDEYWAHPYPCRIVIRTNGGIRIVSVGVPRGLSAEEARALGQKIVFQYVSNCNYPKRRLFEELDWPIESLLDGPGIYLWQIAARGLPAGERLRIVDHGGETLGTGIVSTQGEALLTAVASFAGSGIPVTIVRDDFSRQVPNTHSSAAPSQVPRANHLVTIKPAATEAEMMAMSIRQDRGATLRQTRLLPGAEIALPGECLQLATKMDNGRPLVLAVTSGMIKAFDVRRPAWPVERWAAIGSGFCGIVNFAGKLWAWGDDDIRSLQEIRKQLPRESSPCGCGTPVRGAGVAGQLLWLLRNEALHGYDERLCEVARIAMPRAKSFVAVGGLLVVADDEGLTVLDPKEVGSACERKQVQFAATDLRQIAPTPALRPHPVITVTRREYISLMSVTADGVQEIARYTRSPWFAQAVRLGRVLAFPTASPRVIGFAEAVETALN
jgi:hypothetical protein